MLRRESEESLYFSTNEEESILRFPMRWIALSKRDATGDLNYGVLPITHGAAGLFLLRISGIEIILEFLICPRASPFFIRSCKPIEQYVERVLVELLHFVGLALFRLEQAIHLWGIPFHLVRVLP